MKLFLFALKYLFRTLHIGSFGLIFGNIIYDYLWGRRLENIPTDLKKPFSVLHIISSIILIISGLVNMIILVVENKYAKTSQYDFWKKLLIFKFLATLSITPLLDLAVSDKDTCFKIRTGVVFGLFIISPFIRYFREGFLVKSTNKAEEYELVSKSNKD
jgi:hypothetical protein